MSYIYLDRELFTHPLWNDRPYARGQAWVDLIQLAQFRPSYFYVRGLRINVDRGQLCHSQDNLAKRWGWGKRKVAKFISDLLNDRQIEVKVHHRIAIITICNYDDYQTKGSTDDTTDCTTNSTTNSTHTKEGKKGKEIKGDFGAFWNLYPNKKAKPKALKSYEKALEKTDHPTIMAALAIYIQQTDPQFYAHPSTWLNQERWTDEHVGAKTGFGRAGL